MKNSNNTALVYAKSAEKLITRICKSLDIPGQAGV